MKYHNFEYLDNRLKPQMEIFLFNRSTIDILLYTYHKFYYMIRFSDNIYHIVNVMN